MITCYENEPYRINEQVKNLRIVYKECSRNGENPEYLKGCIGSLEKKLLEIHEDLQSRLNQKRT